MWLRKYNNKPEIVRGFVVVNFTFFFFSELGPYTLLKISSGAEHTRLLLDAFCEIGLALTQGSNPQS